MINHNFSAPGRILVLALALVGVTLSATATAMEAGLSTLARVERAMNGEHRSEANRARNIYRHPVGTLEFFGLREGLRVMEIWPGAGWYTEILAPTLRNKGTFIVASYDTDVPGQPEYRYRLHDALMDKLAANPGLYDQVQVETFSPPQSMNLGEANSLDMILTFRNMHGWLGSGDAEAVLAEFHRVLKPGGVLGIVQHRADAGADPAEAARQGYVPEATMIELAEKAGFELDARSEVNANPKDTHNHPEGVWTLPPSLRLGDEDQAKYLAIGESDRMTLRFRKH